MKNAIRPLLFAGFAFLMVFLMQTRIEEMERQKAQLKTVDESSVIYADLKDKPVERQSNPENEKKADKTKERVEKKKEDSEDKEQKGRQIPN